ncbi:hypothetical protein CYPRO_2427 [Cyclonatronum proteinivorum]|uniref:Glycosyl transferase family 2 n=2 Tax=Cyclonatronum proteinivorum TaxID=1457365 RepID=A0A345UMG7_9BACT|nr:hypothetical protein CYPRO_2427 [Cyclonatronum proteinivorum]
MNYVTDKGYAPVFISVYDRVNHFKQCIETLSKCEEAKNTTLYISSDQGIDPLSKEKVNKIRMYIEEIKAFKEVVLVSSEKNTKGKIIRDCYKLIRENNYDRLIRAEDDIIFSSDFLCFMNESLSTYENCENIYSISGFSHSTLFDVPDEKKNKVYFAQRYNPWGTGFWIKKRKDLKNKYSNEYLIQVLRNTDIKNKLNAYGLDRLPQLSRIASKKMIIPSDYRNGLIMILENLYTVYPYTSKTWNIGLDGSGLRTKKSNRFDIDLKFLEKTQSYVLSPFSEDQIENRFYKEFFSSNRDKIKYLLYKSGLYNLAYHLKPYLK